MAWKGKVAKGGSILVGATLLKAGTVIEEGREMDVAGVKLPAFTKAQIEQHIRSGFLIPVAPTATHTPEDATKLVENAPGKSHMPPLNADSEITPKETPIKVGSPVGQVNTIWNLDPATLAGKSVDELNVMVLERDANAQPFETAEEAAAHLSQDHGNDGMLPTITRPAASSDSQIATAA